MGINGVTQRIFDRISDYDLTKYPVVELASEHYMSRALIKVPDGCYITVDFDDESEEQNEP